MKAPARPPSPPLLPEVTANFALTWDARVSTRAHTPANFTSPRDKSRLLEIRATGDAVMVGRGTVETDRMRMGLPDETLRRERLARGQSECPLRVVIGGPLPHDHPIFACRDAPLHFFSRSPFPEAETAFLASVGAQAHLLTGLPQVLETLATRHGVRRVVCEGGPTLLRSLLEADCVNEIHLTWAPVLFGGLGALTLTGPAGAFLPEDRRFRLEAMERTGDECYTRYRLRGRRRPSPR